MRYNALKCVSLCLLGYGLVAFFLLMQIPRDSSSVIIRHHVQPGDVPNEVVGDKSRHGRSKNTGGIPKHSLNEAHVQLQESKYFRSWKLPKWNFSTETINVISKVNAGNVFRKRRQSFNKSEYHALKNKRSTHKPTKPNLVALEATHDIKNIKKTRKNTNNNTEYKSHAMRKFPNLDNYSNRIDVGKLQKAQTFRPIKMVGHKHVTQFPIDMQFHQAWESFHEWARGKQHGFLDMVGRGADFLTDGVHKKKAKHPRLSYTDLTVPTSSPLLNTSLPIPLYQTSFFQQRPDQNVFINSVFYDDRLDAKFLRVVLLGLSNKQLEPGDLSCIFSMTGSNKFSRNITVPMDTYETCEPHDKAYSAYLGSCEVPKGLDNTGDPAVNVSMVFIHNEQDNVLAKINVINNFISHSPPFHSTFEKENPNRFAVCVPPLFGNASALRVMEFVEVSSMFGANHFVFYVENIGAELERLLRHYQTIGMATLLPWRLPRAVKSVWYHGQSAAVWDCMYRTMNRFQFALFTDFDEILVPRMHKTWTKVVAHLSKDKTMDHIAGFQFASTFFSPDAQSWSGAGEDNYAPELELGLNHSQILDNLEASLVTLNFTQRTRKFNQFRTKMMVNPLKVFELGIHHLSKPLKPRFKSIFVPPAVAGLNHYRTCQTDYGTKCNLLVADDRVLQFKKRLVKQIKKTLTTFNYK